VANSIAIIQALTIYIIAYLQRNHIADISAKFLQKSLAAIDNRPYNDDGVLSSD
jgi:hypothetical protein